MYRGKGKSQTQDPPSKNRGRGTLRRIDSHAEGLRERKKDYSNALARRPHRTIKDEAMIEVPTVRKPTVTRVSCQGNPLRPAAVMGERAAVPNTAASKVTNQL